MKSVWHVHELKIEVKRTTAQLESLFRQKYKYGTTFPAKNSSNLSPQLLDNGFAIQHPTHRANENRGSQWRTEVMLS